MMKATDNEMRIIELLMKYRIGLKLKMKCPRFPAGISFKYYLSMASISDLGGMIST